MGTASLICGVLALLGNVAFFLSNGQSVGLFWGAIAAAIAAIVLGVMSRPHRHGRLGLTLGVVSAAISVAMIIFLTPMSGGVDRPVP